MHLGVNLQKAQVAGIHQYERELNIEDEAQLPVIEESDQCLPNQKREYIPIDTFVHSFCKLLGQRVTPEYGQGNNFENSISYEFTKAISHGNIERAAY